MLKIDTFIVGPIETNCYIITDTTSNTSAIIDPGLKSDILTKRINQIGKYNFKYILLTHGHFDHIGGVSYYKDMTNADIVISQGDCDFPKNNENNLAFRHSPIKQFNADIIVKNEDTLFFGEYTIKVMTTPGHTIGSVCYFIDNNIFTGDTLMKGCIGRTDFPTSNFSDMVNSINDLNKVSGEYKIFCGHGESTTLSYEKMTNPYMR